MIQIRKIEITGSRGCLRVELDEPIVEEEFRDFFKFCYYILCTEDIYETFNVEEII